MAVAPRLGYACYLVSLFQRLLQFVLTLGPWGLPFLGLMDSSSIPFPPELLLIPLTMQNPRAVLGYSLLATAGSAAGSLILFGLARRLGGPWVEKKMSRRKFKRLHGWLEAHPVLAVLVPAAMPPPIPTKLFVLAAGAFEMSWGHFLLAMSMGRFLRFFVEAVLIARFGPQALLYMRHHVWVPALLFALALLYVGWRTHLNRVVMAEG
ncbi:MAG: YqaA family protein [Terriglobales bacterium]